MKILLALVLLLCVSSCERAVKPIRSLNSNNPDSGKIDMLFIVDGCKIYRFEDYGYAHYFTTCKGSIEATRAVYQGKTSKLVFENIATEYSEGK